VTTEIDKVYWECQVCDFAYDEVEEGVPWNELPEDWVCPLCGASREEFQKVIAQAES